MPKFYVTVSGCTRFRLRLQSRHFLPLWQESYWPKFWLDLQHVTQQKPQEYRYKLKSTGPYIPINTVFFELAVHFNTFFRAFWVRIDMHINYFYFSNKHYCWKLWGLRLCRTKEKTGSSHASDAFKKVKIAHTRLLSVGSRSWSQFLAVSLQVTWIINPTVGYHYFPPGPQLPRNP